MQDRDDIENLRWLRVGYLVDGVLCLAAALVSAAILAFGIAVLTGLFVPGQEIAPLLVGVILTAAGGLSLAITLTLGICNLLVARYLRQTRRWMFCMVVAAVNCLFSPIGVIIGIFTFVVLVREPVKQLFDRGLQPNTGKLTGVELA